MSQPQVLRSPPLVLPWSKLTFLPNLLIPSLWETCNRYATTLFLLLPPMPFSRLIYNSLSNTQTQADAAYLARHVGLQSGVPIPVPALTLNRLCGSGFQTVISAAQEILLGESSLVVAAGTESMSQAPYVVRNIRFGSKLGVDPKMEDSLWAGLSDTHCGLPMGITAENLAEIYQVTRAECDNFALSSQQKWGDAHKAGVFAGELAPVTIKTRKGDKIFNCDEHPKLDTTSEGLGKLPTVFKPNGTVTAGSASGICDGAGAIIVAGEAAVDLHKLKPMVELVAWHVVGVEPSQMGIGPVPAIEGALRKAKLTLEEVDFVEINEAFAAQALACAKALSLPLEKLNLHGGAIALGHPLAASGSRITAHAANVLATKGSGTAVVSACIGGGQGIALVLRAC
jgi:acetyl-CoA acyltransferase 2